VFWDIGNKVGVLGISILGYWEKYFGILGISILGYWEKYFGILGKVFWDIGNILGIYWEYIFVSYFWLCKRYLIM
jgi:hypothetical protein